MLTGTGGGSSTFWWLRKHLAQQRPVVFVERLSNDGLGGRVDVWAQAFPHGSSGVQVVGGYGIRELSNGVVVGDR